MKKILRKYWMIGAFLGCLVSCSDTDPEDTYYTPATEIGRTLMARCDEMARMFADTTFVVALGVEETDLHFQVKNGYVIRGSLLRVDLNTPGLQLRVAMPDNSNDVAGGWQKQTLTDLAACHDETGARVAAMVNGDFWDTSTTLPRGPVHRNGFVVSDRFNPSATVPQQALSFIAVQDDGRMIIADSAKYRTCKPHLKEVTGAGVILLSDGIFPGSQYTARDPRTAVGYTADGIVYLLTVDGRRTFYSYGMTYAEMASFFRALGCTGAANLDGGGSAQMLIRNPVAQIFQIRNCPADNAERAVINGWMVTVDEP